MGWWLPWGNRGRVGIRGTGICPGSEVSAKPACGPETLTMEIALGGRPDDSAKMVWSRGCIAYLSFAPVQSTLLPTAGLRSRPMSKRYNIFKRLLPRWRSDQISKAAVPAAALKYRLGGKYKKGAPCSRKTPPSN